MDYDKKPNSNSDVGYYCKLCDVQCVSYQSFENHAKGHKHCKKYLIKQNEIGLEEFAKHFAGVPFLKLNKPDSLLVKDPYLLYVYRSGILNKFNCRVCSVKQGNPRDWRKHIFSKKHQKKIFSLRRLLSEPVFLSKFGDIPGPFLNETKFCDLSDSDTLDNIYDSGYSSKIMETERQDADSSTAAVAWDSNSWPVVRVSSKLGSREADVCGDQLTDQTRCAHAQMARKTADALTSCSRRLVSFRSLDGLQQARPLSSALGNGVPMAFPPGQAYYSFTRTATCTVVQSVSEWNIPEYPVEQTIVPTQFYGNSHLVSNRSNSNLSSQFLTPSLQAPSSQCIITTPNVVEQSNCLDYVSNDTSSHLAPPTFDVTEDCQQIVVCESRSHVSDRKSDLRQIRPLEDVNGSQGLSVSDTETKTLTAIVERTRIQFLTNIVLKQSTNELEGDDWHSLSDEERKQVAQVQTLTGVRSLSQIRRALKIINAMSVRLL